jgi:hypothetical protein
MTAAISAEIELNKIIAGYIVSATGLYTARLSCDGTPAHGKARFPLFMV